MSATLRQQLFADKDDGDRRDLAGLDERQGFEDSSSVP